MTAESKQQEEISCVIEINEPSSIEHSFVSEEDESDEDQFMNAEEEEIGEGESLPSQSNMKLHEEYASEQANEIEDRSYTNQQHDTSMASSMLEQLPLNINKQDQVCKNAGVSSTTKQRRSERKNVASHSYNKVPHTKQQATTIKLPKPSEQTHKVQKKYSELASLIPKLKNFDWYDTSAFSSKIRPIKFLTPISFWFMVCVEYFPRRMVYSDLNEITKELLEKIQAIPIDVINRVTKLSANRTSQITEQLAYANSTQNTTGHIEIDKTKCHGEEEEQQQNQTSLIQEDVNQIPLKTNDNHNSAELIGEYTSDASAQQNRSKSLEQEIRELMVNRGVVEQQTNEMKIYRSNKQSYTMEDDLWIIQNRIAFIETVERFSLISSASVEEKLEQIRSIGIDSLLDLVMLEYQEEQHKNKSEFELLQSRMAKEFADEFRISDGKSIDFTDILVDLHCLSSTEQEYFQYLESKQQIVGSIQLQAAQQQSNGAAGKSQQETVNRKKDETRCQVCNQSDFEENDVIVHCSTCNLSVHQKCYGLSKQMIASGWQCQPCKLFGPQAKYLRCALCSRRGGALKRSKMPINTKFFETVNPSYHGYLQTIPADGQSDVPFQSSEVGPNHLHDQAHFDFQEEQYKSYSIEEVRLHEPKSKDVWVHLTCALWVPEVYFEERSTLNLAKGIESIDEKRFDLLCQICKQKKSGCCIQCAKGKCSAAFHPECARRAGMALEVRIYEKFTHLVFCEKHTPLKLRRLLESREKKDKEEITKFCRSIEKYNETYYSSEYRSSKNKEAAQQQQEQQQQQQQQQQQSLHNQQQQEQQQQEQVHKQQQSLLKQEQKRQTAVDKEIQEGLFMKKLCEFLLHNKDDQNNPIPRSSKQSSLRISIQKQDIIWNQFQFKDLSPLELFQFYKHLILTRKEDFQKIFLDIKTERDAVQEEQQQLLKPPKSITPLKQMKPLLVQKQPPHQQHQSQSNAQKQRYSSEALNPYRKSYRTAEYSLDYPRYKYRKLSVSSSSHFDNDSVVTSRSTRISSHPSVQRKSSRGNESSLLSRQQTEESSEIQLYCYCQTAYKEGDYMIECSECEEWFHFQCIGYLGNQFQAEQFYFCCSECNTDNQRHANQAIYDKHFDFERATFETYLRPKKPHVVPNGDTQQEELEEIIEEDNDNTEDSSSLLYNEQANILPTTIISTRICLHRSQDGSVRIVGGGVGVQQTH